VRRSQTEMYIGLGREYVYLCVRLSLAAFSYYCENPDVTLKNGRRWPLVVHYWANLQSVHGFRCYDNIPPNAKCQRVLVLALCLVAIAIVIINANIIVTLPREHAAGELYKISLRGSDYVRIRPCSAAPIRSRCGRPLIVTFCIEVARHVFVLALCVNDFPGTSGIFSYGRPME